MELKPNLIGVDRRGCVLKLKLKLKSVCHGGWAVALGRKLTPVGPGRWRIRSADISWAGRARAVLLKLEPVGLSRLGIYRIVRNLEFPLKLRLKLIELWHRFFSVVGTETVAAIDVG